MAEVEQRSFFSEQPGELTFVAPVSDNIIDIEQYRQRPPQIAIELIEYKGGPSVNVAERRKAISRIFDNTPKRKTLRGLMDKIETSEGWKKHMKEWNERRKDNEELEGTEEEFRQYISNVKEKYNRLGAEMLGATAVLAARDEMLAWGYLDDDFASSEPQAWLIKFREEYKDPGKRDAMAALMNEEHYSSSDKLD